MGLQNASLLTGSTITPTGGTAQNFTPDGQTVANGLHLIDASVADFRTRPTMTVKTTPPASLPDGSFTKDKRVVTYVEPFIDTKGHVQYDYIRIERRLHPESSAAKGLSLNNKGAQICVDSDFASFFSVGSLA